MVNYDSELKRAGAHSTQGWRRLAFLAQRYVLGTHSWDRVAERILFS